MSVSSSVNPVTHKRQRLDSMLESMQASSAGRSDFMQLFLLQASDREERRLEREEKNRRELEELRRQEIREREEREIRREELRRIEQKEREEREIQRENQRRQEAREDKERQEMFWAALFKK